MNTIVNKIRLALLLGFMTVGLTVLAQSSNISKMSMSTQMFLDELAGKISFDEPRPSIRANEPIELIPVRKHHRPIASPDTINGKVYISAFVRVTGEEYIREMEVKGVEVMSRFDNGLLTALIPIDSIEEVAAIEGVTHIEVGERMEEATDLSRQASNVDDVLTLSQDAALAGLQKKYDGKDVILAIIDNGIDFQHIAFKDKNGNSRIKRAYRYDGSSATEYTGTGALPTADATDSDHGTHTSSIAGGSSVIVNGTDITVTDDHASATYGGMAPGADLYLAGINGLISTYISTAFQKIVQYADEQGKPLVVSNSWSNSYGPRDGYNGGSNEQVVKQYFGESHPNRICLFASANRAGNADPTEGGGLYASGTSSSANPFGSILRYHYYSNTDNGYYYSGTILDAWARSTSVTGLALKIHVLNTNTGEIVYTTTVTPTGGSSTTVSGLSTYYSGTFTVYWATNSTTGKRQVRLYASGCRTQDRVSVTGGWTSNYTLAVEVYPTSGSSVIDMWAGTGGYFTNYLTTSGHNWALGSDDISVSDHAVLPEVISVGSYVTRGGYGDNSIGDISEFSGYAVEGVGPLGTMQPWITAPGEVIISAFNHSRTDRSSDPLINNANNPYGASQGTSMATPAAAGIVALWMQAAKEVGKTLTLSEVKTIMKETAIRDSWVTSGPNASHFGNGKIDALAGIEYILREYAVPTITATPTEVTFDAVPQNTYNRTVTVGGIMLTGDITATLNDPNGVYSINTTNLGNGGDLVITYNPADQGNHNATIVLTSPDADPVTITITGTSRIVTNLTVCEGTATNGYLPIYGYYYENKQINQMIYPASLLTDLVGKKIKSMTFYSSGINFSGGAFNVSIGTTTQTAFTSTQYSRITGLTTVSTGQVAVSGGTELVINFDSPFEYTGGNLVIDFEVTTTGNYATTNFYGVNQSSYTSFNTRGTSLNTTRGVYTGSNSGRRQFLPKVTFEWDAPFTAGTVSPTQVTFTGVPTGSSQTQNVTITNTGNQSFTPVINTADLPSEFTVTGNDEVATGGTLNLIVTYNPSSQGSHSGSFTVTIGGSIYTVTVSGDAIKVNRTVTSNAVTVPVYHTDATLGAPYSQNQVDEDDLLMQLPANVTNSTLKVLVKNDSEITRHNLYHSQDANNWTMVAIASHDNSNDSYTPLYFNGTPQGDPVSMNGESSKWMTLQDTVAVKNGQLFYVPETEAYNMAMTHLNTYGSRRVMSESALGSTTATVVVHESGNNLGSTWDVIEGQDTTTYCVYIPIFNIVGRMPITVNGVSYEPYLYRAWVICDKAHDFSRDTDPKHPALIDGGALQDTTLLGYWNETMAVAKGVEFGLEAVIGEEFVNDPDDPRYNEKPITAFAAPMDYNDNIRYVVRFYYKRIPQSNGLKNAPHKAPVEDGEYFIVEYEPTGIGNEIEIVTGLNDIMTDKEVIDVTFVNPMGMVSKQPFDGINIIVTRYNDGSISTSKVIM